MTAWSGIDSRNRLSVLFPLYNWFVTSFSLYVLHQTVTVLYQLIVTTNLAFSEWTQLFENTPMVAALVNRLAYRSHVLDMSSPSYRLLTAQTENEAATAASNTAG